MIDRLLKRGDVDPVQLKALLKVSLKMDLRGPGRAEGARKTRVRPLVWSLVFYAMMGVMLSASLVERTSAPLYMLYCLAYAQTLSLFIVLLEFGNTLVHPDDGAVVGPLPVSSRTYFLAKLIHLVVYVSAISAAVSLGPALMGMALPDAGPAFPLVFAVTAWLACLAAAALVTLVYTGLLGLLSPERLKDVLAALQALFAFAAFLGYQLIPRLGRSAWSGQTEPGSWLWFTPPAWFMGLARILDGSTRSGDWGLAALALASLVLLSAVAVGRISLDYADNLARLSVQPKGPTASRGRRRPGVAAWIRDKETRAGYELAAAMMRRDRQIRMSFFPLLGMPLAFGVLALMDQDMVNPLAGGRVAGPGFGSMVFFFVFFLIHSLVQMVVHHPDGESAWVMRASPVRSPGRLLRGAVWALVLRGLVPFYGLLTLLYGRVGTVVQTLLLMALLIAWGLVFLALDLFLVKDWPFSKARQRGDRTAQLGVLLLVAPFFGLVTALLHLAALWPASVYGGIVFGLVLYWILERRAVARITRRLGENVC